MYRSEVIHRYPYTDVHSCLLQISRHIDIGHGDKSDPRNPDSC